MKAVKWISAIVAVALAVAVVAAPIGPMPGILIGGTASEVPTSWGDTASILEIQLQIGEGPLGRTVTIWTVEKDGDLYVTGQQDSGWTRGIGAGGPVRVQMAGKLYELTATPVSEGQVDVLSAWQAKYASHYPDLMEQFPAPEEALGTAVVYRLTSHS